MSLRKEDSSDLPPFVRGSKFRKSFRIRQRYNAKLPPAAILFMKSLEKNKVSTFEAVKSKSIFYTTTVELEVQDEPEWTVTDDNDPFADEQKLIKKSPILRRRSSMKKLSGKKELKMSKLIQLFRK